jgi:hypothetical protein
MGDDRAGADTGRVWAALSEAHAQSGLVPLLLAGIGGDPTAGAAASKRHQRPDSGNSPRRATVALIRCSSRFSCPAAGDGQPVSWLICPAGAVFSVDLFAGACRYADSRCGWDAAEVSGVSAVPGAGMAEG